MTQSTVQENTHEPCHQTYTEDELNEIKEGHAHHSKAEGTPQSRHKPELSMHEQGKRPSSIPGYTWRIKEARRRR